MTDLERLKILEKEIGQPLEQVEEIEWGTKGYTLNEVGEVTGLGLWNMYLKEVPKSLEAFKKLEHFSLSRNQVRDIHFLESLTQLKTLFLRNNQIQETRFLKTLIQLEELDLHSNEIEDLSFLKNLTELQSLHLSLNQIENIHFLEKLTKLQHLNLSGNQIRDYSFLGSLDGLQALQLSSNKIEDASFLTSLTQLQRLDLSNNKIRNLHFLESLTQLKALFLRDNQVTDAIFLENLTQLLHLDLSYNKITNIEPLLPLIQKGLYTRTGTLSYYNKLNLDNNPIAYPPLNIVEQGNKAILTYFEQFEEGEQHLYEGRILIAGESGAGKTTLFKKFQKEKFRPTGKEKSTHGINIGLRTFPHMDEEKKAEGIQIKAHIWDFGGQDVQSYLHQYFFTDQHLILLVCDLRKENTPFDYWFEVISRLAPQSKVIVVGNMRGRETATVSFDLKTYETRFPDLMLDYREVDFNENDTRWENLLEEIAQRLSSLGRVNEAVPKRWKPIREALEKEKGETLFASLTKPFSKPKDNYSLSYDRYQEICEENGVFKEKYQIQCLEHLHWLGLALHYDDPGLSHHIFIQPEWITKSLYEVLREDNYIQNQKGRFTKTHIFEIWEKKGYKKTQREQLLALLQKDRFEVCYPLQGTDEYLVPILLPDKAIENKEVQGEPYTVRFHFPFMPFGFFSRLIVRLHQKAWSDYVWHTGFWLKDGDTSAFLASRHIYETGQKVIEVSIYGDRNKRVDLLQAIRHEIKHLKANLYKNVTIDEQIPCFCEVCKELPVPYYHSRKNLDTLRSAGTWNSQCQNSGKPIPIVELLQAVISQKEIDTQIQHKMSDEKFNINVNPKFENIGNPTVNLEQAQQNQQAQKNEQSQTTTVTVDLKVLKELAGQAELLKEDVEKELERKNNRLPEAEKLSEDEIDDVKDDVLEAETALKEVETAVAKQEEVPEKTKTRLKQFVDDLSDEKSTLRKGIGLLRRGKDYGVKILAKYNTIAADLGLEAVPESFLGL